MTMFSLEGKRALVTGATGGLGAATAKRLAAAGAKLIVTGRNVEKLEQLRHEIGHECIVVAADLADEHGPDRLAEAWTAAGGLDLLVCNAGVTRDQLALRMKMQDFDDVLHVNLRQSFALIQKALKAMMKQRYGRIVAVTSVVGHTGNPGQANYCAAKAGLTGMVKALAQECASRGVTVNCVAPGFIRSPMTDVLDEQRKELILKTIPAGDMGDPEDVASAVHYLLSEEARYVTGTTLHVNGGMAMF